MILSKKQYTIQEVCCEDMHKIIKEETRQHKVTPETGEFYLKIAGVMRKITACPFCNRAIKTKSGFFSFLF